jgi:hypothetical protein
MPTGRDLPTLAEGFETYARSVYKEGMSCEQARHVFQAFIAGAWLVLSEFSSEHTDEETILIAESWNEEAVRFVRSNKGKGLPSIP